MAQNIDKVYEDAIASGLLPGISLLAGDKDGNILYSKSLGKDGVKEGGGRPFTASTICAIASMTKLMTSVAVLQCVEDGTLNLDDDVKPILPEIGKYGRITGFDEDKNSATLVPDSTTITLRMLLSHTSGHEYDWFPLLAKWRASRNEAPWGGPTVEDKSVLPLVFTPGTGFAYGAGHDWAGRALEVATKSSLHDFMHARIWKPLGIEKDASFHPFLTDDLRSRTASISTLNERGEPPAVDAEGFDLLRGGTKCFGGAGVYTSAEAYYKFVSAILRRDPKLLTPPSYDELFRPQLDAKCEQALNDYVALSPAHTQFLGMRIPESVRKTWSFAGLVAKQGQEGRSSPGAVCWGGVPSCVWFIDNEAGICGVAMCQIVPPMAPSILALHEEFQKEVYQHLARK